MSRQGPPKGGGQRSGSKGGAPRGGSGGGRGSSGPSGRSGGGERRGANSSSGRPGGRPSGRPGGDPKGRGRSSGPTKQSGPKGLGGMQVEGRQAVRELLLAGDRKVYELMLSSEGAQSDIVDDIIELAAERRVLITEMSRARIDAASHTEASQGVIARASELQDHNLDELCEPVDGVPPFLIACDGVTDPGNLGALLRIAECAGVTGVLLPKHRAVHVTPTVTKAAAGAIEYLPMALVGGMPSAIDDMKKAGIWVVGLDAGGDLPIHDLAVADKGVCLVLGAEGSGLSRLVRQRCDAIASIPLHGRLASLNVASAGAIATYEVARRRTA